jgi:ATP-dependent Clp protease ATP-binding subunit ClpC
MQREILPKVKVVMAQSYKEAKNLDDNKLKPEHIIMSIISDNDNECIKIFKMLKIDTIELYDRIVEDIRRTDITARITNYRPKTLPFSNETKILIKNLDRECEKINDTKIDTTHIMLSALSIKTLITKIMNEEYNINYETFKKVILETKEPFMKASSYDGEEMDEQDFLKKKQKSSENKSKTPVLDNFCKDITKMAERSELDPVIGREEEISRVIQILSRRKKNNPILIGEPGVGKSSIIDGLSQIIINGIGSRTLINKKIYSLDLASIVAGTKYRGQFEERMKAILEECKANKEIILFIDEVHNLIGAGNASGSLDASNIFKPALARGEIQIIGATTLDEYRENIEKDGALTRRFQQVFVKEPTIEETKKMLMNLKERYEMHHKVKYSEEAIEECVKLADRYIMDRAMPDKAIDIMDEAGAITNVRLEKPKEIIDLEDKKAEINEKKKEVVLRQRYEEAAKLRDEEKKINEKLEIAIKEWNESLNKRTTEINIEHISRVVSMMTGIPLTKISTQESKRLLNLDKELMGKVIGQDHAVSKVIKAIKRSRVGIKNKNRPNSYIFLGNTGTGKSLLAKLLAEHVYGDVDALIRLDMSEYMEKHSVSRIIGSPPGYIGHEQGGQLTEKVRRKPYCVVLLDEIEKAHEDIYNLLLQVLDEGHLTDSLGRKINFKNTIIIMTSNIGVKEVNIFGKGIGFQTSNSILNEEVKIKDIIEKALKKKFNPEFLNRIDETIIFNRLSENDIDKIIYLEIEKLENRLREMNYKLNISKESIKFIGRNGYDENYGARPLSRAIQHYIEDPIADEILNENFKEGEIINVNFDDKKQELTFKVSKDKTKKT